MKKTIVYELMHMERLVAQITTSGKATIYDANFLPYDLYFEEDVEFSTVAILATLLNIHVSAKPTTPPR